VATNLEKLEKSWNLKFRFSVTAFPASCLCSIVFGPARIPSKKQAQLLTHPHIYETTWWWNVLPGSADKLWQGHWRTELSVVSEFANVCSQMQKSNDCVCVCVCVCVRARVRNCHRPAAWANLQRPYKYRCSYMKGHNRTFSPHNLNCTHEEHSEEEEIIKARFLQPAHLNSTASFRYQLQKQVHPFSGKTMKPWIASSWSKVICKFVTR